jgi:hypothetical protein
MHTATLDPWPLTSGGEEVGEAGGGVTGTDLLLGFLSLLGRTIGKHSKFAFEYPQALFQAVFFQVVVENRQNVCRLLQFK